MKQIKKLIRLIHINYILAKNGLDNVIVTMHLFAPLRFLVYLNPWNWFRKVPLTRGEALRKSFEELGPIFVKFGQALSTRPDLLPEDIALELSKLQDKVPPIASEKAVHILQQAYGESPATFFAQFDSNALASASIAQVHAATLKTGEDVIVKILRPNIQKTIKQDISLLYTIAHLIERYWPNGKRLKPVEIIDEFRHSLTNELDLIREAANAAQLRRNFANSPLLYIPEIYWDYNRTNILVMERIHGIPVTDIHRLKDQGIDIKKLAERGVEIFFTQVFRDCFFHADMHPGNIFVSYQNPQNPQYICIDFGIIGTLSDDDKLYLAGNLHAFFNRDYRRVAQLHIESGWVSSDTRLDEFEAAIRTVCEPIFEKPLKEISLGQIILRLFQVARRFHMEVQPQLVLLQKTFLAIEGLGRQLYPDLDLWTTAKPFLEKWLKEQMGPKAIFNELKQNLPFFARQLPHMPRMLFELLEIKKQQLFTEKEQRQKQAPEKTTIDAKSVAWGVLAASIGVGVFDYFKLLNYSQLTTISIIGTISAAVFICISSKKPTSS